MMEKLHYDNLHKFFVSLGIALMSLPIVIYVFMCSQSIPLISKTEYSQLSMFSIKFIQQRQVSVSLISKIAPFIIGILFIIGLVLFILGVVRWYKIQNELDEQIRLDTRIKSANVEELSENEKFVKAVAEVKEEQQEETYTISEPLKSFSIPKKDFFNMQQLSEIFRIEDICFNYARTKYIRQLFIKRNVRIGKVAYDFIGISRQNTIDYFFEVKSYITVMSRSDYICQQLLKQYNNYVENTGKECRAILMTVVPSDKMDVVKKKMERIKMESCVYDVIVIEDKEAGQS